MDSDSTDGEKRKRNIEMEDSEDEIRAFIKTKKKTDRSLVKKQQRNEGKLDEEMQNAENESYLPQINVELKEIPRSVLVDTGSAVGLLSEAVFLAYNKEKERYTIDISRWRNNSRNHLKNLED
ncbi:hypothetical protein FQA39_LY14214 [Lamprigera yunnana]|nr:hypothetical protein FQA39_LY14214 [Lamprigera yunnana]